MYSSHSNAIQKAATHRWVAAVQRVRILRVPIIGGEMKTKGLLYYCRLLTVDDVDALLE